VAGGPDPGMELELTGVSPLRLSHRQESFSLLFKGPADRMLPQQTYSLENGHIGQVDIFLVPVDRDHDGIYYEAIFNRMAPGSRDAVSLPGKDQ
jgi:hypothetical protein